MIRALIEIGRSVRGLYPTPLIEVPYSPQNEKNRPQVIVVELVSKGSDVLSVSNIYLSDYSLENAHGKYIFRSLEKANRRKNLKNERI